MTVSYTPHFHFTIPDFDQEPWHALLEDTIRALDSAIHDALIAGGATNWANSTVYAVGHIVLDNTNGSLWVCAVAHTSPASPTTFLSFRTANPTYWNASATIPQQKGTWLTATAYIPGDFVVDNGRYAVCIVGHVSGTFNTDLGTGKWSVLIDVSNLGVGINAVAEDTIASAATTDVGSKTATRLSVSGAVGITSFGNTANTFKILRFASTPAVTHDATNLILLGAANRTMRAGDIMWIASDSAFHWREIAFFRADGNPATAAERGVIALASTAEAQAGTDTVKAMTAARTKEQIYALFVPATTAMIFFQAAAPVGWTKSVVHNDKAIRIVSGTGAGSGGSSAFTTVFGKTATDAHTLTLAESAAHDHGGATGNDSPVHTHNSLTDGTFAQSNTGGGTGQSPGSNPTGNPSVNHTHSITSAGGGGSHTHPIDIRVQYIDCIICTKD